MTQQLPPGQGPIDPRNAFFPPPSPGGGGFGPPPGKMPGGPMGPMMFPPGMLPPPRRSSGLMIFFMIVLLLGLIVSVLINIFFVSDSISTTSGNTRQTVLVSGDSSSKIAVIPVDGMITDASLTQLDHLLTDVAKDSAIKALVIEIDTPGGSATASDEMYHRIEQFKGEKKIPITISMRGMATSGGYYIACGGDYIWAEPGTLTGNIGVLFPRFNISELAKKYGVDEDTITATTNGHSYKNAGSMFKPHDPQDEKYLQGLVDDIFKQFQNVVNTGRKGKLVDAQGDIFSGKAFIASDALTRGLIDQIGYPSDAYAYAATNAGLTKPTIVRYTEPPPTLLQLMMGRSTVPAPSASSSSNVTINGVNIDGQTLRDLITARPMLLWRAN